MENYLVEEIDNKNTYDERKENFQLCENKYYSCMKDAIDFTKSKCTDDYIWCFKNHYCPISDHCTFQSCLRWANIIGNLNHILYRHGIESPITRNTCKKLKKMCIKEGNEIYCTGQTYANYCMQSVIKICIETIGYDITI